MKAAVNKCGRILQDEGFTSLARQGVYYRHRIRTDPGRDNRLAHDVGAQRDALSLVNRDDQ